jgi:hypothetical protein
VQLFSLQTIPHFITQIQPVGSVDVPHWLSPLKARTCPGLFPLDSKD